MSLKVVKFDTKMYLNFSNFRGRTSAGGAKPWSKNGDKCQMGGGIGKIFAGWGDPPSPPQEKTLRVKGHLGVSWGQVGVNLLSNALWPPILVGRIPDQSIMHCWGHPGVKLLRNALWPPNLVGRIPDQSLMHCWGQRSCRGQPVSTRGQIA